jgi:hypothetical protein
VFVPTQTMPAWLEPFAANQPVTVVTNALRGLILGQGALPPGHTVGGQVALALLWTAAIIVVFAPLAVRIYSRTVRRHPRPGGHATRYAAFSALWLLWRESHLGPDGQTRAGCSLAAAPHGPSDPNPAHVRL